MSRPRGETAHAAGRHSERTPRTDVPATRSAGRRAAPAAAETTASSLPAARETSGGAARAGGSRGGGGPGGHFQCKYRRLRSIFDAADGALGRGCRRCGRRHAQWRHVQRNHASRHHYRHGEPLFPPRWRWWRRRLVLCCLPGRAGVPGLQRGQAHLLSQREP